MSREKQIEEMARVLSTVKRCDALAVSECIKGKCEYPHYDGVTCIAEHQAEALCVKGYRKASEVALEAVDDFQRRIRHIFLNMCNGNDYDTLNLLQIDSAIEALYDTFIAELKKKYTEGGV